MSYGHISSVKSMFTLYFQGFGNLSSTMYKFLLPVIELSTDLRQPEHVYLMDDGLELWHITLTNAEKMTPEMLNLYKNVSELLGIYLYIYLKIIYKVIK